MQLRSEAARRRVVPLLGLAALAGYSSAASAQGWVVGGGIGAAAQQEYIVAGPVDSFEDTDSAYRVFGAYMVTPTQGVMASYVGLGTTFYEGASRDEFETTGIDMSYKAAWAPGSQGRFALFGAVGLFVWDQKVESANATSVTDYSDDGTSFSLGVGTDISFGANRSSPWGIHLEWQLFKNVGDAQNSGHKYDREILSVGASYRFGGG
jgi:hypothetical protein